VEQFARTIHNPPFGLKDLELLTLEAEAWALAARSDVGIRLLAEVYNLSSRYMAYRDRAGEAVPVAERYFDVVHEKPRDGRTQDKWLGLKLIIATARLDVPGLTNPRRGLEELRWIFPHTCGTRHEVVALSKISEMLLRQGAQDEALKVSREASQVATSDEDAGSARGDHAIQLIQSGRYNEGIPLLSSGRAGDWYRLVETSLWKAEALIALGEKTEAERALAQAQSDLALYEMTPLQPRLDGLQARLLHGEPVADGLG
jgi:predicted negative regulator of RcsB-dependent stress response